MIDIYHGIKEKGNMKRRIDVKEIGKKEMRKRSVKNGKIGKEREGKCKRKMDVKMKYGKER